MLLTVTVGLLCATPAFVLVVDAPNDVPMNRLLAPRLTQLLSTRRTMMADTIETGLDASEVFIALFGKRQSALELSLGLSTPTFDAQPPAQWPEAMIGVWHSAFEACREQTGSLGAAPQGDLADPTARIVISQERELAAEAAMSCLEQAREALWQRWLASVGLERVLYVSVVDAGNTMRPEVRVVARHAILSSGKAFRDSDTVAATAEAALGAANRLADSVLAGSGASGSVRRDWQLPLRPGVRPFDAPPPRLAALGSCKGLPHLKVEPQAAGRWFSLRWPKTLSAQTRTCRLISFERGSPAVVDARLECDDVTVRAAVATAVGAADQLSLTLTTRLSETWCARAQR